MLVKTVLFETGDAELRYCCTIFWKVVTLRNVFGGRCHQLQYCCTTQSEIATLRKEIHHTQDQLFQKVSLLNVDQEQSDYYLFFDY